MIKEENNQVEMRKYADEEEGWPRVTSNTRCSLFSGKINESKTQESDMRE